MGRHELVDAVLSALRENNAAAVMFHGTVADRFQLSVTDLKALDILQRSSSLTAGEIGARTGLAAASVTSLIDRLARKRFVSRRRDPADRRRVIVSLSPGVEARFAVAFHALHESTVAHIRRYSDADLTVILSFLTGAARAAREAL